MSIPYVGFNNNTLAKLPSVAEGEEVPCAGCSGMHRLECGVDDAGNKSDLLMFYRCPSGKTYLGAVGGKLVMFKKPDIVGSIEEKA